MKTIAIAGAVLLSSTLAVSAQTGGSSTTAGRSATAPASQANAAPSSEAGPAVNEPLRQQVRDNLTKAGFTDIRIMPTSFLIRAKDQSGNPVMMVINPDSFTEVTAVSAASHNNNNQNNSSTADQKH
jgi:hypothetical protein